MEVVQGARCSRHLHILRLSRLVMNRRLHDTRSSRAVGGADDLEYDVRLFYLPTNTFDVFKFRVQCYEHPRDGYRFARDHKAIYTVLFSVWVRLVTFTTLEYHLGQRSGKFVRTQRKRSFLFKSVNHFSSCFVRFSCNPARARQRDRFCLRFSQTPPRNFAGYHYMDFSFNLLIHRQGRAGNKIGINGTKSRCCNRDAKSTISPTRTNLKGATFNTFRVYVRPRACVWESVCLCCDTATWDSRPSSTSSQLRWTSKQIMKM